MSKFPIYLNLIAIAGLMVSCQNPSGNTNITDKSINYLRSQLQLANTVKIIAESTQSQTLNTNDLCQTSEPKQAGFVVKLVADDIRYIVQTNQDASKIELCGSEDAQPASTNKYMGTGYQLRYPANWQVLDLGLESTGASTVMFTPNRDLKLGDQADLVKQLQQQPQVYILVKRQPMGSSNTEDLNRQDVTNLPFDAKVKGAKSGKKQTFSLAIANSDGSTKNWKVQELILETEKFLYIVTAYQPDQPNSQNISPAFEQFTNSFALIQS